MQMENVRTGARFQILIFHFQRHREKLTFQFSRKNHVAFYSTILQRPVHMSYGQPLHLNLLQRIPHAHLQIFAKKAGKETRVFFTFGFPKNRNRGSCLLSQHFFDCLEHKTCVPALNIPNFASRSFLSEFKNPGFTYGLYK